MANREDFIGVFDSGVGGISVLRELVKQLPQENFLYFGDSANAPYGAKTTQQVRDLTLQNAHALASRNIKALVVACNTATAAAIDLLRQTFPDTIVIGIEPALKPAAEAFPTGRIGIMATGVTLREEKLAAQTARFPEAQVIRIPAPGLVELIEKGLTNAPETEALLLQILAPYQGNLDALVLGCTHYPFVKDIVARILGPKTRLFDGGEGTARQTRLCLEKQGLLNPNGGSIILENSADNPQILQLCHRLLDL